MKLTLGARLYDAFYLALCAVFFGPAIGGFLFGLTFVVATLAVFAGGFVLEPMDTLQTLAVRDMSHAGNVLLVPFAFAVAAYIPGVPIAALASLITGARIVLYEKTSRKFIWLSGFASPLLLTVAVMLLDGKPLERSLFIMGAILCVVSVVCSDIVYRTFGRHLSVSTDLVVLKEGAILDSVRKTAA
jgi:hypothetical protein